MFDVKLNSVTEAIVAVPGFDHGKVTDCFNQIGVLLGVAIADLKVTIAAKLALEGLLILNGVACTLADLGGIVYALLLVRIGPNLHLCILSLLVFSLSLRSL